MGLNNFLDWTSRQKKIGSNVRKGIAAVFCIIPIIALVTNFGLCDQSRNYTAYEHAVNIFRTADHGSTIFLDGDNNIFSAVYGRIVEGMGEGILLQDRHNVIFKWRLKTYPFTFVGKWDKLESTVINSIIDARLNEGVYFAVLSPFALSWTQEYHTLPYGILRKVLPNRTTKVDNPQNIWMYYYSESFHDNFNRDYMSRRITSHYFFRRGESLWLSGKVSEGMRLLKLASRIGYNDTSIHSDLGIFFTDRGLFENARRELEKALNFYDNLSGVRNNWGYYHHKMGNYEKAVASFKKAIKLAPDNHAYYNNLGFTLSRMGNKEEAMPVFRQSLSIRENQPIIKEFVKDNSFNK